MTLTSRLTNQRHAQHDLKAASRRVGLGLAATVLTLAIITSAAQLDGIDDLSRYNETIRLNPSNPSLYDGRGRVHGMRGEIDKAISDFTQAIHLNPQDAVAYSLRAKAYSEKGDTQKALGDLNEAIKLNPSDALAHNNRGYIYSNSGDLESALRDLSDAIRLNPAFDLAYANRGYAYSKKREFHKALSDLSKAISLNSTEGKYYNSLAWLLATCPDPSLRDGTKAVEAAKKACELVKWRSWYCVGTLAAAYAELGDFEAAIKYQVQALNMSGLTAKDRSESERRLQLYRQSTPYHEP